MPKPFFERLTSYFEQVGQALASEAAACAMFPNSTDVGTSRELLYGRFLQAHVPKHCAVEYGGFLFGLDGSESKQIDIIVSSASSPQFRMSPQANGKSFTSVDGAVAVVSAKSTLAKNELWDSLENFAKIPAQQPMEKHIPIPQLRFDGYTNAPYKIIYANDCAAPETMRGHLTDFYRNNPGVPASRRVDLIHVLGKYYAVKLQSELSLPNGQVLSAGEYFQVNSGIDSWPFAWAITRIMSYASVTKLLAFNFGPIADGIKEAVEARARQRPQ